MTEDRGNGPDSNSGPNDGDTPGDGLDAWLAANFPPPKLENPPAQPPAPSVPFADSVPPPGVPDAAPPPVPESAPAVVPEAAPPAVPPVAEELGGIPPASEFPPAPTEAFAETQAASGLDALFGESNFVEYKEGIDGGESPFARRPVAETAATDGGDPSGEGVGKSQKVLLWVAGSLVALLALIALFVLGTKLPAILGPAPSSMVDPVATPTPTPTATELPLGPVEPGEYVWDELLGGECIASYVGPWEVKYEVVDCEVPHPAQLVTRGTFAPQEGTVGYPGVEVLQSQVNLLCTAPDVVDYAKATAYTNIQFEASFAISSEDWASGNDSYYCFLSRSDGGDLTGTIAMPQVAPAPPAEEPAEESAP